ncbi:hypothetical protein PC116_g17510 [Phytophthora cactorum]|uniref:Chromo domain-containing protein n=1 Tax=Phytophthora cactorum TaxID=29920 RepID=A0A8T1CUD6_9STRA|nr:hypothetical protein PC111_g13324 [Phytophthora cactorum]KAG2897148.1 hypothetical protein PC114_g14785 [Phytophthora cactorum]KAG2910170.1 hypothetical protein PC115_g12986 [Phytophthora cactorum]KAG2928416.1 hypothetical protein PC117_g14314 [Phytophthora cactorum]KAG2975947.1 hypothetical protein PC118_g13655 [Phytophthora cactorum]
MPSTTPVKNAISPATEFKTLCVTVSKSYKIRVTDEAIRHLRLTRYGLDDVRAWFVPPSPANDEESDDEAECSSDEKLDGEKQHYVRKLLNWKHQNRKTYYLVDWEPTWEPREHLNKTLVAAFEKERRLLVRKTFIEDEAVEDNTLNNTEA